MKTRQNKITIASAIAVGVIHLLSPELPAHAAGRSCDAANLAIEPAAESMGHRLFVETALETDDLGRRNDRQDMRERATEFLIKGAEFGARHAELLLAMRYRDGIGATIDRAEADRRFANAALSGEPMHRFFAACFQPQTNPSGDSAAAAWSEKMVPVARDDYFPAMAMLSVPRDADGGLVNGGAGFDWRHEASDLATGCRSQVLAQITELSIDPKFKSAVSHIQRLGPRATNDQILDEFRATSPCGLVS